MQIANRLFCDTFHAKNIDIVGHTTPVLSQPSIWSVFCWAKQHMFPNGDVPSKTRKSLVLAWKCNQTIVTGTGKSPNHAIKVKTLFRTKYVIPKSVKAGHGWVREFVEGLGEVHCAVTESYPTIQDQFVMALVRRIWSYSSLVGTQHATKTLGQLNLLVLPALGRERSYN